MDDPVFFPSLVPDLADANARILDFNTPRTAARILSLLLWNPSSSRAMTCLLLVLHHSSVPLISLNLPCVMRVIRCVVTTLGLQKSYVKSAFPPKTGD